jgi:hypothetical protein
MQHRPTNRMRSFNGSVETKRSKSYRKLTTKPKRTKHADKLSRPYWFDSSNVIHRMFLIAYDLLDKVVVGYELPNADPLCTDLFLYEAHMHPAVMQAYKRLR